MEIRKGGLEHPSVVALLGEHLHRLSQLSPPESVHALGMDALKQGGVDFWSAWNEDALLGFVALKRLDDRHAEIKSMRTARAHLGKGVAAALLRHILDQAERCGFRRLSLETGSAPAFAPAHRLYERFGFVACGPFGNYDDDRHSVFMTRGIPTD
jgi:putative acetyltransferase